MSNKISELNWQYLVNSNLIEPQLKTKFGIDLNTIDKCIEYLDGIEYLKYTIKSSFYHGTYVSIYCPHPLNHIDTILKQDVVDVFGANTLEALQIAMLLATK